MISNELPSYYDLLELSPDASQQEIRAAYLRSKAAYKKDSVALYSLISDEETSKLLTQIEEAYNILSNPDKRRDYDQRFGHLSIEEQMVRPLASGPTSSKSQKIISIDRVPPMEDQGGEDHELLVAPSTDFESTVAQVMAERTTGAEKKGAPPPPPLLEGDPLLPPPSLPNSLPQPPVQTQSRTASTGVRHSSAPITDSALSHEIEAEVEWRGITIRRFRELRRVAIEEVAEFTKISKNYLFAIEEENYEKLPAPVYLRGFLTQVCKFLRLPPEKLIAPYMARHNTWLQNNGRHR